MKLGSASCVSPQMDDNWRDDFLEDYEGGVWIVLTFFAVAILGLILWLGYDLLT